MVFNTEVHYDTFYSGGGSPQTVISHDTDISSDVVPGGQTPGCYVVSNTNLNQFVNPAPDPYTIHFTITFLDVSNAVISSASAVAGRTGNYGDGSSIRGPFLHAFTSLPTVLPVPVGTKKIRVANVPVVGDTTVLSIEIALEYVGYTEPNMVLTPASLEFTATAGDTATQVQTIDVTYTGSFGTGMSPSASWCSPSSTVNSSTDATLTFTVDPTGLGPGVYVATVHVTTGDGNSPQSANITLTVTGGFYIHSHMVTAATGNSAQIIRYTAVTPLTADYTVQADILLNSHAATTGDLLGVVGRCNSAATIYYSLNIGKNSFSDYSLTLTKSDSSDLAEVELTGLDTSVSHTIKLVMTGASPVLLQGYVDNVLKISITDGSSPITAAGKGGIQAANQSTDMAYGHDNVEVMWAGGTVTYVVSGATGGPVLKRDYSVYSDNGTSYSAHAVIGSLVLAHPGQMAKVEFLALDARLIAGANAPVLKVILDEALPYYTGTFTSLTNVVDDPPQLPVSTSLYSKRAYLNQAAVAAWCRHMQIKIDFGTDAYAEELLSLTIFGNHYQEL